MAAALSVPPQFSSYHIFRVHFFELVQMLLENLVETGKTA